MLPWVTSQRHSTTAPLRISPSTFQKNLASIPPFSREKPVQAGHIPQALSGGAAGTDVLCGRDQVWQEETLPFE